MFWGGFFGVGAGLVVFWLGLVLFFLIQHFLVIPNTPNTLLLQVGTMYHLAVQFIMQAHYHTHYCEL